MEKQITHNEIRKLLGNEYQKFSDEEIKRIHNQIYELTYYLFDIWKKQELKKTIKENLVKN